MTNTFITISKNSISLTNFPFPSLLYKKKKFIFVDSILREQTTAKVRSKLVG